VKIFTRSGGFSVCSLEDIMGRLNELKPDEMRYPFGRCAKCGEAFTTELRKKYHITHCPYCGMEIDDFMSFTDCTEEYAKRYDLFCDDCGHRIYEATKYGKGGDWIDTYAGVCGDGCGRELCGKCGDWGEETGLCADCHRKDMK
jgi:DNA-directed RNA polymerase subunit RPC12/RpoP